MVFLIISDFVFTVQAASNVQDESGTSKKFGFVSFERQENADEAIKNLDNTTFDGKRIRVLHKSTSDETNMIQFFDSLEVFGSEMN